MWRDLAPFCSPRSADGHLVLPKSGLLRAVARESPRPRAPGAERPGGGTQAVLGDFQGFKEVGFTPDGVPPGGGLGVSSTRQTVEGKEVGRGMGCPARSLRAAGSP